MDINREIAEKVMGWNLQEVNIGFPRWFKEGVPISIRGQSDWNPKENIDHAFEVVEKLRPSHCCFNISSDHDYCWRVELIKASLDQNFKHEPYVVIDGEESLPMAICLAALRGGGTSPPWKR